MFSFQCSQIYCVLSLLSSIDRQTTNQPNLPNSQIYYVDENEVEKCYFEKPLAQYLIVFCRRLKININCFTK